MSYTWYDEPPGRLPFITHQSTFDNNNSLHSRPVYCSQCLSFNCCKIMSLKLKTMASLFDSKIIHTMLLQKRYTVFLVSSSGGKGRIGDLEGWGIPSFNKKLGVTPQPLGPPVTTHRDYRLAPQTNTSLCGALALALYFISFLFPSFPFLPFL